MLQSLSLCRSVNDVFMYDVCGTPEYLAPEVVARVPYTQSVDLWALGVISYIIMRGKFSDANFFCVCFFWPKKEFFIFFKFIC